METLWINDVTDNPTWEGVRGGQGNEMKTPRFQLI